MVEAARVNQTVDLTDLRAALLKFADAARDALYLVENDSETFTQWLGGELLSYWRQQVRRCEQHVAQAKVELSRCLASKVFDQTPSCHDQRLALRKAQQRLEHANHKVETVRKWERQLREELIDYRARAQQMNAVVDVDVPRAVAYLDRLLNALQAYLAAAPPGIELPPLASLLGSVAGDAPTAAAPVEQPPVEPLSDGPLSDGPLSDGPLSDGPLSDGPLSKEASALDVPTASNGAQSGLAEVEPIQPQVEPLGRSAG